MALQVLSVDLEARLVNFIADMGKAAYATSKAAKDMNASFGIISSGLKGLGAGITLGGIVAFTKASINSVDALNDLKDATGASIENLSALEDVAARTGTTMESVGGSLVKFNAALKDAKPDNDQGAAFRALGLSVKELQALDPAEALRRTAVALSQFADDGNKARLVQELFGKSVRETAPFLRDLAEQGALVAKVTTQQAEEAEKFNKELFNMQKNVQDLTRFLSGGLVSAINETAERFRVGAKEGKNFFEIAVQNYQKDASKARRDLTDFLGITTPGPKAPQFLLNYNENESAAESARLARRTSVDFVGATKPIKTKVVKEAKELDLSNKALASYIDTLERNVERTQDLSNQERALLFLRKQGAGATLEQAAAVLNLAKALDAEAEQNERIRIGRQSVIDSGVDNSAYQARLKGLLDNTSSSRIQAVTDDVGLLQDELEAGRISLDQYVEAVQARIGFVGEEVKKTKTFAEEMGLTFTSAFEDAIVGGKSFSQVLKGLGDDILRITLRRSITEPLGGFFSSQLGNLFSFDGGGYTGGGARAGGVDGKGGFLSVLHPRETVIDHTKGRNAGTVNLYLTQNNGALVTPQELARNNEALVRQIQGAMMRSQQYGGALA